MECSEIVCKMFDNINCGEEYEATTKCKRLGKEETIYPLNCFCLCGAQGQENNSKCMCNFPFHFFSSRKKVPMKISVCLFPSFR